MKNKNRYLFKKRLLFFLISQIIVFTFWDVNLRAQQSSDEYLIFHITNFGINQLWTEQMKVGNPFLGEHNRVFPELNNTGRQGSQILLPMPTDEEMKLSDLELTDLISNKLQSAVTRARNNGIKEFEIQLVQNINTMGYADFNPFTPSRQKMVRKFEKIAYSSIGNVISNVEKDTRNISIDITTGSNGTMGFTESINSWKSYKKYIRSADFIDGRALIDPMRRTIIELGAEKVSISNVSKDWYAPTPIISQLFKGTQNVFLTKYLPTLEPSIGAQQTVKQLVKEFPNIKAFLFKSPTKESLGDTHVRRMTDQDAQFNVWRWQYDGTTVNLIKLANTRTSRQFRDYFKQPKNPIPNYTVDPKSKTEIGLVTRMVGKDNRTVLFGNGSGVQKTYDRFVTKYGRDNVKWIRTNPSAFQRQQIAWAFDAKNIVNTKNWSYRETVTDVYRNIPEIDTRVELPSKWRDFPPLDKTTVYNPPRIDPVPLISEPLNKWKGGSRIPNVGGVGGVMLSGGADVSGDMTKNSGFSLIFENPDGEIDIRKLRMFVTALWAVYFGDEGPGISIDPIAPNIDKHLVRYIGQVKNSDLGRVMRDADYEMKQLAVGLKTSNAQGFMSPMQIASKNKVVHVGAMSRFWFVPENMQFRQIGNALIFEDGQVSLKTEYLFSGKDGEGSPENEEFARFFTDHYWEIAEDYPVLFELFEYSKLVSLAHYLKEKQVPLLWFLLSNREMLITEDSPGTVDELIKKSAFSQDTIIVKGGVDLKSQSGHSNYIIDKEAADAIATALANYSPDVSQTEKQFAPTRIITFESATDEYSMVPMNDFTLSGSSASGEKYQTDFLFEKNSQPRLELARFYDMNLKTTHTFGEGWHLMIPLRVEPVGKTTVEFLNAVIPKTMQVHNLLTGEIESLEFSADRYTAAGYVPIEEEETNTVGLFIMSNGSFRLVDRIGSEFHFDQAGRLENMLLTWISDSEPDYSVKYKYSRQVLTGSSSLYRIEPVDNKTVEVLNVRLPERMKLIYKGKGSEEIFLFSKDNKYGIIGYLPLHEDVSKYTFMALMSDGSFILEDSDNSQYSFNSAGQLESVSIEAVESMTQDDRTINFEYELDKTGLRINRAIVRSLGSGKNLYHINYQYGDDGRLISTVDSEGKTKKIIYDDELGVIALQ